jgi:hypothetical protein
VVDPALNVRDARPARGRCVDHANTDRWQHQHSRPS